MSLEQLANLGEFVAAVGVIISLVYLAIQVRQANAIARANAYRDFNEDLGTVLINLANNPDLHRIWRTGLYTDQELDPEERDRLGILLYQIFGVLNAGYHYTWLDPGIEQYVKTMIDMHLHIPHICGWWTRHRQNHPEPFRSYVDRRHAEITAAAAGA